jgi:adenosylhomocysteine nucleosidase
MLKVLIVTALGVEFNAVKAFLNNPIKQRTAENLIIIRGETLNTNISVSIVQVGYGNAAAAAETTRAIQATNPTHVFFVGIAGGLKEDVKIGDVVVADKMYSYSAGKASDAFQPRPELYHPSYAILQEARHVVSEASWPNLIKLPANTTPRVFKAFVKPIVSGEQVVSSTKAETYSLIRQNYGDALAVEMEGYGFHTAFTAHPSIQNLVVRGISDLIDNKSVDEMHELASATAAAFVFALLDEIYSAQAPNSISIELTPTPSKEEFWSTLFAVIERLYPEGPEQLAVWERAGGEKGRLNLRQPGLTVWYQALQLLRNGGGGQKLTPLSLLEEIKKDHPNDSQVLTISQLRWPS